MRPGTWPPPRPTAPSRTFRAMRVRRASAQAGTQRGAPHPTPPPGGWCVAGEVERPTIVLFSTRSLQKRYEFHWIAAGVGYAPVLWIMEHSPTTRLSRVRSDQTRPVFVARVYISNGRRKRKVRKRKVREWHRARVAQQGARIT
jgi:hypothetical protein